MNFEVYEPLRDLFLNQKEALETQSGKVNLVEHKALGNCLNCMEYMENYHIDLDLSEISLEVVDIMLKAAHDAIQEDEFDNLDRYIDMFAGYVSMVIVTNLKGEFAYNDEGETVYLEGNHLDIQDVVAQCIHQNTSVLEYYQTLK